MPKIVGHIAHDPNAENECNRKLAWLSCGQSHMRNELASVCRDHHHTSSVKMVVNRDRIAVNTPHENGIEILSRQVEKERDKMLAALCATAGFSPHVRACTHVASPARATAVLGVPIVNAESRHRLGFFAIKDVLLVERSEEDVKAFHAKESRRWLEVYDETYVEAPQDFYPGDRVKVVGDCKVKEIENAKGMTGVVTHFEFDDGYESCQTCSTSGPVTVRLDES